MSRVASAIISLLFSILTILFLYGYLAPIGLPSTLLGPEYASMFSLQGSSPYGSLIPGGAVGLVLFQILTRIGSVTAAATAPSMPSSAQIMRNMNFPSMMGMQAGMPAALPSDITRSQFVILRCYRQGYNKPKKIGRYLSMDSSEVEKETKSLIANGYLTKNSKLTSKAM